MQKGFSVKVFLTSIYMYMAFAYVYQSFHVVQEFRSYQSTHLILIENSKLENFSEVSIFVELNAQINLDYYSKIVIESEKFFNKFSLHARLCFFQIQNLVLVQLKKRDIETFLHKYYWTYFSLSTFLVIYLISSL